MSRDKTKGQSSKVARHPEAWAKMDAEESRKCTYNSTLDYNVLATTAIDDYALSLTTQRSWLHYYRLYVY